MHKYQIKLALTFVFLCVVLPFQTIGNVDSDIYRPPSSSFRCKNLVSERSNHLTIKSQLVGLLERNSQLIKNNPIEKESTYRNLVFLRGEIKFKLHKRIFKLKSIEEQLVRSGCPSILSSES